MKRLESGERERPQAVPSPAWRSRPCALSARHPPRREGGEKRGMRAIPWPEARKQGPISFDFLQQGVARHERFWQNETNRERLWQNETNVNVSAAHINGRLISVWHVAGRPDDSPVATDRLRDDASEPKLGS